MTQPIVIFGAGGHGREILQIIRDINAVRPTWQFTGFLVDEAFAGAAAATGLQILGDISWLAAHPDVHVVVALGPPAARRRVVQRIRARHANPFPVLVHPRAWIGAGVVLQEGAVVCAGAMLTTDIRIGAHAHVNVASTIAHDAVLEDFATLGPGVHLAGHVRLGEGVELGTGCVVIPGCSVGSWARVGAGAVVTAAVADDSTVVGVPARPVSSRPPGWHAAPD